MKQISFFIIVMMLFFQMNCSTALAQNNPMNIWDAASKGDLERLKTLVAEGVDINQVDDRGNFTLILAIIRDHTEVVKYLLENGADVNVQTSDGYTPLMYAITRQNYEVVKALIDSGANLNIQAQSHGNTALILAAKGYSKSIVRLLLETGADPSLKDDQERTALMVTTEPSYPDTAIAKLLATGLPNFRLHIVKNEQTIPIHFTIDKKQETATFIVYNAEGSLLLSQKISDIFSAPTGVCKWDLMDQQNQKVPSGTYFFALQFDDNSYTKASGTIIFTFGDPKSLLIATERGDLDLVKQLLANGADIDINVKDNTERTPLMIAAREGFVLIARELIAIGADVYEQDMRGDTALGYAVRSNNSEMIKLIRELMVMRRIGN